MIHIFEKALRQFCMYTIYATVKGARDIDLRNFITFLSLTFLVALSFNFFPVIIV